MRSRNGTRRRWFAGLTAVLLALALVPAAGVPSASSQEAPAYEESAEAMFPLGSGCCQSVAVDGDRMVVKASTTTVNVYEHDGSDWQLTDSLVRPLGTPTLASQTQSLDLSGDTIVAGASTGRGAHVWQHDGAGWVHNDDLINGELINGLPEDYTGNLTGLGRPSFGRNAVATTGDTIYVGGDQDGEDNSRAGAVWVFALEGGTWVQKDKLQSAVPHSLGRFGFAIAVHGDRLLVGAPVAGSGRAHLFERDGAGSWAEAYRLRGGAHRFGHAVALRGGMAAVADFGAEPNTEPDKRVVHVFDHVDVPGTSGIWARSEIPDPDTDAAFRNFGNTLAIEDDRVLVGDSRLRATPGDESTPRTGGVYVFDRAADPAIGLVTSGWDLVQTLRADDQTVAGTFGLAVASGGDWLTVTSGTPVAARGAHIFEQTRTAPPSMIGELDDLGTGAPNVVPNEVPQLHDTILDLREPLPAPHEIVPEGSPLASDIDWAEAQDETDPPFPHALAVDGDRMVACSGMTGDMFQDLFANPWLVAYERGAGGWQRVQELEMPMGSCFGGFGFGGHVLDGDTVVMPSAGFFGHTHVEVYTHDGTEWAHSQDLVPSLPYNSMDFDGDVIATSHEHSGTDREGGFVVFTRDGPGDDFVEDEAVLSGEEGLLLGHDVSVSNGRILLGAPNDRSELRRVLQEEQVDLPDDEQIGPFFDELNEVHAEAVEICRELGMPEENCRSIGLLRPFVRLQQGNPGGAHVYEREGGAWTLQARLTPDVELTGFTFGLGATVQLLNDTAAFDGAITLSPWPHAATIEGIVRNTEILLADLVFNPLEVANYAQNPELFLEDVLALGGDVEPEENMKVGSTWVYRALPAQSKVWALEARLAQPMHGYVGPLGGGFGGGALFLGNEGNRLMTFGAGDHLLDPDSSRNPLVGSRSGTFIFDRPAGLGGWVHTFRDFRLDSPSFRSPIVLDQGSERVVAVEGDFENPDRQIRTAHPSLVPLP